MSCQGIQWDLGLGFLFSGHQWPSFLIAGSFPSIFFFAKEMIVQHLCSNTASFAQSLWVPRLLLHGDKLISCSLLRPNLFRRHLPHPAIWEPTRKLFISWASLPTSHEYILLSFCLFHVPTCNTLSLNPTLINPS